MHAQSRAEHVRLKRAKCAEKAWSEHPKGAKLPSMKTSIELDDATMAEVQTTANLIREKPATVIRLAVRAGLAAVTNRYQATRPDGYFKDAYPLPEEMLQLEKAMTKAPQRPDR